MIRKYSKIVIVLLLLIECLFTFLSIKSFSNKNITKMNELNEVNKEMFSMYVENDEGEYEEYTDSEIFTIDGYTLDLEKSNCVDNKGNIVNDVLSNSDNKVTISSNKTSYCYLYFSLPLNLRELCQDYSDINVCEQNENLEDAYGIWNSTLEDDGYRYVGTNPNNYICFGTTNKTECVGNTDMYMYRIIGIFEDSEGNEHLKLIKKEALNTAYAWHNTYNTDTAWDESDLYKGINGSYFLTNTTYFYMQDSTWADKIATWNYIATNTLTYINLKKGPYYFRMTVKSIYLHELNRDSKSEQTCYYDASTVVDCSIGEWKEVSAKIGLMYASDYLLPLGNDVLEYTVATNYETLKTGWIELNNNDPAPPNIADWIITRYGYRSQINNCYSAGDGYVIGWASYASNSHSVRPVFYLTSDIKLSNGTGTSKNPFIIS